MPENKEELTRLREENTRLVNLLIRHGIACPLGERHHTK